MSNDPWRVVEPLIAPTPEPRDAKKKINPGEGLQTDAPPVNSYSWSCRGGTITVSHAEVSSRDDALRFLVRCLQELWDAGETQLFTLEYLAASYNGRRFGMREGENEGILRTDPTGDEVVAKLHFVKYEVEDGLVRLLRMLNAAARRRPKVVTKWGVTTSSL